MDCKKTYPIDLLRDLGGKKNMKGSDRNGKRDEGGVIKSNGNSFLRNISRIDNIYTEVGY